MSKPLSLTLNFGSLVLWAFVIFVVCGLQVNGRCDGEDFTVSTSCKGDGQ